MTSICLQLFLVSRRNPKREKVEKHLLPLAESDFIAEFLFNARRDDGDNNSSSDTTSRKNDSSDVMSEVSDLDGDLHIGVESNKSWVTPEDEDIACIDTLSKHMRQRPLLPPHPNDANESWLEADSGIAFPVCHCAFKGCAWVSDELPCGNRACEHSLWVSEEGDWTLREKRCRSQSGVYGCCGSSTCLRQHLIECHEQLLQESLGFERVRVNGYSYYLEAIALIEQEHMPLVGCSIDRRTFKHIKLQTSEDAIRCLVCMCCARVLTSSIGWSDIAYINMEDYCKIPETTKEQ